MTIAGRSLTRSRFDQSPGAVRTARWRDRQRRGLRCVTLDVRAAEIEHLIRGGYLDPRHRADPIAVRQAFYLWLDRVCP